MIFDNYDNKYKYWKKLKLIFRYRGFAFVYIIIIGTVLYVTTYHDHQTVFNNVTLDYVPRPPIISIVEQVEKLPEQEGHKLYFFMEKPNLVTNVNVSELPLFPKDDPLSDRVMNQLLYMPPDYENYAKDLPIDKYKQIHFTDRKYAFWENFFEYGTMNFEHCPVYTCNITTEASTADLIIYYHTCDSLTKTNPDQLHMVFTMESPFHSYPFEGPFDWVSTYRRDSDIVADYGTWIYYDKKVTQMEQKINYAAGKTKKVAWFVSNCNSQNNRLEIAKELSQYIQVDIYGNCGSFECLRSSSEECFKMLAKDYKFYLSFENSNCRDYITEKSFGNALNHEILPIVMGARPEDYQKYLPEKSFIHVDDFESVENLGAYLNLLDKDDVLYNSYFKWRGTGEIIEGRNLYWCRVCSMLHNPNKDPTKFALSGGKTYQEWTNGEGVCNRDNWKPNYKKKP